LDLFFRRLLSLIASAALAALSAQTIEIRPTTAAQLPWPVDSNSPAHWWKGTFVLFNGMFVPNRSQGPDQFGLANQVEVKFSDGTPTPLWIEATWMDKDGTLFAWYHHEPVAICPGYYVTAPKIGALVSYDNGYSFQDLGIVLESGDPVDCQSQNGFFGGGNGDFSVIQDSSYFYFFYSNYGGDVTSQGVAVARMNVQDRFHPSGSAWKYYNGGFTEPGLRGRVTPTFPAKVNWNAANADSLWGPSVHWNTALNQYVMLLNHSCCAPWWPQEGIYLSLNPDISNPTGWSAPAKILNAGQWYPQVIGEGPDGTDKLAGAVSRLYIGGSSYGEMVITSGPTPDPLPDDPQSYVRLRVGN
jgi:hypothetical protein